MRGLHPGVFQLLAHTACFFLFCTDDQRSSCFHSHLCKLSVSGPHDWMGLCEVISVRYGNVPLKSLSLATKSLFCIIHYW